MSRRGPSIRWRLTLWWGGLFALFGLVLLLATALMIAHEVSKVPDGIRAVVAEQVDLPVAALEDLDERQLARLLVQVTDGEALEGLVEGPTGQVRRRVEVWTLAAVGVLAVLAGVVGWFVAGRMLRPLRTVTLTARRISDTNLRDRIAPQGPRDELRELAEAFDEMLARLESGFEAQRAFAADASHELRTPLTLVRAEVDVTLADPEASPAEVADALASIRRALDQSEELTARLIQLASAEVIHDRRPVDLAALARHSLEAHTGARDHLEVRPDLALAVAGGDPTLLASLVDNLVHNAVCHGQVDDAGTPWLAVRTASSGDGEVVLEVANGGAVLAAEDLARLTDRFFRPDPSRARATGGSGLGLAIVATIVRTHGGHLHLAARDGGGLDVTVRLPAADDAEA
ncbi:HAMP domain-containing protein [Nitriliruptoraceae bacterium ZYF776]|nr:HAMP domain-containing protein [Profundirhabdus halotolerans]